MPPLGPPEAVPPTQDAVSNLVEGAVLEHHRPEFYRELPERLVQRREAVMITGHRRFSASVVAPEDADAQW